MTARLAGLLPAALAVWLLVAPAAAAPPAVLLEEHFNDNARGWLLDTFSRLEGGAYVVAASQQGGYYRWINEPANLRNFSYQGQVQRLQGDDDTTLYGLLCRVQDNWRNSYFFLINGRRHYYFGKFVEGQATILKEGVATAVRGGLRQDLLRITAIDDTFGLSINDTPVANVVDATFTTGGRIGVALEAPGRARFDDLLVTAAAPAAAPDSPPPSGVAVRFQDSFDTLTGWPQDEVRQLRDGAYHLVGTDAGRYFVAWQPKTAGFTDFVARVDARFDSGDPNALYGLCWRVLDGDRFHFFLLAPDGRFYAGVRDGQAAEVKRTGRQMSMRPADQANTLELRAEKNNFSFSVNGVTAGSFQGIGGPAGSLGLYVQQAAHVVFDDFVVTDLPQNAPPVVGGGTSSQAWPTGALVWHDRLTTAVSGAWPVDSTRRYEAGGYCIDAPERGSRTTLREDTFNLRDGVVTVTVRPLRGQVQSSMGLVFRANQAIDRYYYLLLNSAGTYLFGRRTGERFEVLDSGPVARLRGGDVGNTLQVTFDGPRLRYGINDQALGAVTDATYQAGAVGLYVEHGLTACFRDLRLFKLP